jgi:hypothetical protein
MSKVYYDDWNLKTEEEAKQKLQKDFNVVLTDEKILLATYLYEDWTGDAYVLFEKDNKLFSVHGSHCSCYGLEDQWEAEEISVEMLEHILKTDAAPIHYASDKKAIKERIKEIVLYLKEKTNV